MANSSDSTKAIADSIASLGSAITSPAKIAYIGYIVLAYSGCFDITFCQFVFVTLFFIVIQIGHDDFVRIWLNESAKLHAYKAKTEYDLKKGNKMPRQ